MEESAIYAEIYNSQLVEDAPGRLEAGGVPELESEEN
jgi:hypothetical protein